MLSQVETVLSSPKNRVQWRSGAGTGASNRVQTELSPEDKDKRRSGARSFTCGECPQPFRWHDQNELVRAQAWATHRYATFRRSYSNRVLTLARDEYGDIMTNLYAVEGPDFFYTTRCRSCDTLRRKHDRYRGYVDDVAAAVGGHRMKFFTLTLDPSKCSIPLELESIPLEADITDAKKHVRDLFRRRLQSRKRSWLNLTGKNYFGYYFVELVERAYNAEGVEVDAIARDDANPGDSDWPVRFTMNPHIHGVLSSSNVKLDLEGVTEWWGHGRTQVEFAGRASTVRDYMSKEALAPLVSYVEKSTVHNGRDVHSFGVWNYSSGTMEDILSSKRFEISEKSLSPRSRRLAKKMASI